MDAIRCPLRGGTAPLLKCTLHNTTRTESVVRNCPEHIFTQILTLTRGKATKCTKENLILAFGIYSVLIQCSTVLNFFLTFFRLCIGICLDFNSRFLTKLSRYENHNFYKSSEIANPYSGKNEVRVNRLN
jgi:hypothetical protein